MVITAQRQGETVRDYACRIIKENIVTMELKPGSLVSETELAKELGVSRTPVREALIQLGKNGPKYDGGRSGRIFCTCTVDPEKDGNAE